MPNHASITLVGHIAEPKFSGEGDNICARFGLAVTRKRKAGDVTTWFNVTAWRGDAKFIQSYAKKGSLLLVEGEPYQELYQEKLYLKVDARRVVNLSPREGGDEAEAAPAPVAKAAPVRAAVAAKPGQAGDLAGGAGYSEPPFLRYAGPDIAG